MLILLSTMVKVMENDMKEVKLKVRQQMWKYKMQKHHNYH